MKNEILHKIIKYLLLILSIIVGLVACSPADISYDSETLYPAEMSICDNYIWYRCDDIFNGVKYYDYLNDIEGTLCADPVCDHMNSDCILFSMHVIEILANKEQVFMLANNIEKNETGYYCYNLKDQKLIKIYIFEEGYTSPCWCVSDNQLYFKLIESDTNEAYKENIYRISTDGSEKEPTSLNLEYTDPIYTFWVDEGKTYYIDKGMLKCDGKTILSDVYKLEFSIVNGNIYFSRNVREPDWHQLENSERVRGAQWVYDLYRMPIDGDEKEAELLIKDVYDTVLFNNQVAYYLPYNIKLAFSYPMPGAEDTEWTFMYDMSDGAIAEYDLKDGTNEVLFSKTNIIIWDIVAVAADSIVVRGTDYNNISVEGDLKNTDKSAYYENTGYYILSRDGEIYKRFTID